MTSFCSACGARLLSGDRFCCACGAAVGTPVGPATPKGDDKTIATAIPETATEQQTRATGSGSLKSEILRRAGTLILVIVGITTFAMGDYIPGGIVLVAALVLYLTLPRITPPEGAFTYDRMPAVVMPDILGFFLISFFVAMPFVAAAIEGVEWRNLLSEIHFSAVLCWPMALISLPILFVSNGYANYWLRIEPDGLRVHSTKGEEFVRFDAIRQVAFHRRGVPSWIKALTPFLVLSGKFTQAGAILLARDEVGIVLEKRDGTQATIPSDAFEKPFRRVLKALRKHGVPFSDELRKILEM